MSIDPSDKQLTLNPALNQWIKEAAELTRPERIVVCDGSEAERERLTREAVAAGVLIGLDPKKRPGCYLHRSNPNDVARTEEVTFVCTPSREEAGVTNNWMAPAEAYGSSARCSRGSMTRPHDVRHSVRAGSVGFAVRQGRRSKSPTVSMWC